MHKFSNVEASEPVTMSPLRRPDPTRNTAFVGKQIRRVGTDAFRIHSWVLKLSNSTSRQC